MFDFFTFSKNYSRLQNMFEIPVTAVAFALEVGPRFVRGIPGFFSLKSFSGAYNGFLPLILYSGGH